MKRRRTRAVYALGKIGDSRAVEPLLHLMSDANSAVAREAVWAFHLLRDQRAVEPLLRLWETGKLRREVAWALANQRDKRAVEPIMRELGSEITEAGKSGNWDRTALEMCAYADALGTLGDPRAIPLLKALLDTAPEKSQWTKAGRRFQIAEAAAYSLRRMGFQVEGDQEKGGYRIVAEPPQPKGPTTNETSR
jgi:HEAT repeat protein